MRAVLLIALSAGLCSAFPGEAMAQHSGVFVDDSVTAAESLQRVPDLLAAGNAGEVVRVLQKLLDDEGDRLVVAPWDPKVFIPVRARIHDLLRSDPAILNRYRELENARAEKLVEEGRLDDVERSRFLTTAGLNATIRLARRQLEAGRFDGAAITLQQVKAHPDLRGEVAGQAADLATQIVRYTASPAAKDLARSLAETAGRTWTPPAAIPAPARARLKTLEISDDRGPLDPASIASEPLASAPLATFARPAKPSAFRAAAPWAIPAVAGDLVYTNDGVEVAAWDRWTMVPVWKQVVTEDDDESRGFPDATGRDLETRMLEDVSTVTVGSGVVIAATGYAQSNGRRSGDGRIHAFDPATGAPVWTLDLSAAAGSIAEASVRGPILIVGDTAVIAADRFSQGRRLASAMLVGVDCSSGAIRWVRTLANVGLTSIGRLSRPADLPTAIDGVVYHTDSLGVTAAVEAASGRFRWVRQLDSQGSEMAGQYFLRGDTLPWLGLGVVQQGDSILTIEPGVNVLIEVARADGKLISKRALDAGEQTRSIMRVGDFVALIGPFRIDFLRAGDIKDSPQKALAMQPGIGLAGRPQVSGGKLIVPIDDGLLFVDPASPGSPLTRQLPMSGHPVIAEGQLLLGALWDVVSFQSWDAIEPKLAQAIERRPSDFAPAIAYVNIALKAGRPAGIPAVADRLLAAVDQDPTDTDAQDARKVLFDMLRDAVVGVRDGVAGAPTIPLQQIDAMLARLGRAADTPPERAQFMLLSAWAADAQSRTGVAVEALQGVLQDPELSQAVVPSRGILGLATMPGWLAARTQLVELLTKSGYDSYVAFAAQADRERPAAGSPETLEVFARKFPLAEASVGALRQAAEARLTAGQTGVAIDDLGAAIDAAKTIAAASRRPVSPEFGAVSGRLIALLTAAGREGEAFRLVASLEGVPGLTLTDGTQAIDRAGLSGKLRQTLSERARRPLIGERLQPGAQLLQGWRPMPARFDGGAGRATDQVAMYSPSTRQIGLWARRSGDGKLAPLWTRTADARSLPPTTLRVDWDSTLVYWPGEKNPRIECIGVDGKTVWMTDAFDTILPGQPDGEGRRGETPQEGDVGDDDMMVAIEEQTLVLLRRSGGAVAFDLRTGKPRWSRSLGFSRIFDAVGAGGRLVVAGNFEDAQDPRLLFVDLITGESAGGIADAEDKLASRPRWVRAAGSGVIVGFEDCVRGLDPKSRAVRWTIAGSSATGTIECWPLGDRVLILGGDAKPWLIDPNSATPEPIAMETAAGLADMRQARGPEDRPRMVLRGEKGSLIIGTERGLNVLDAGGAIIGRDTLPGGPFMIGFGDGVAYYVNQDAEPDRDGRREVAVWSIELGSAKLVGEQRLGLYDAPSRLAVLDGKLVLTAGPDHNPITLVFDTVQASR